MAYNDYKDIIDLLILLLIIGIIQITLPIFALTLGRGGEEAFNLLKSSLYWGLIISGMILFAILKVAEFLSKKFPKINEKIGWMGTYIHDYEKAPLPYVKGFKWLRNPLKTLIVFIPIFMIFGVFTVYNNTFFSETPIPKSEFQQITPLGETVLSVEPSGGEIWNPINLLIGLPSSIFIWLARRNKISNFTAYTLIFATSLILYPLAWVGYHKLIYGSSEVALRYSLFFGFITALITILTGSIIPAWIFKDMSNLYKYFNVRYADESILFATIIFIIFYSIIVSFIWLLLRKRKQAYTEKEVLGNRG